MKRFIGLFIALVALVVTSTAVTDASAQGSYPPKFTTRILPGKETVSAAYVDSAQFTIAAATISTNPETLYCDTSDWDWVYPAGGHTGTAYAVAYLNFSVGGTGAVASGIDSVHTMFQTSANGTNFNKTQTATSLLTWNNNDAFGAIPILVDSDGLNATQPFGKRYIRFIVQGDTGGKLGQVTASISYWRRPDVDQVFNNSDASIR